MLKLKALFYATVIVAGLYGLCETVYNQTCTYCARQILAYAGEHPDQTFGEFKKEMEGS